jgi:hypothetical protein
VKWRAKEKSGGRIWRTGQKHTPRALLIVAILITGGPDEITTEK